MIYVTGDMHGDETRLYDREWRKLKAGDILIVLGDFGYLWDGGRKEKSVVDYLSSRKFTICFLDGTHENFDMIYKCRKTVWKGGTAHRIGRNLYHLCRGQIYLADGVKFFTFGGGESDDIDIRDENGIWWRDEMPNATEMAEGAKNLDDASLCVDYILTHEPPSLVKSSMLLRSGEVDHVNKLNGFFEEIGRSCKFRHWYFASLHEDRLVTPHYTALFKKIIPLGFKGKV